MKKILAALFALLLLCSLFGCSGATNAPETEGTPAAENADTTPTTEPTEAPEETLPIGNEINLTAEKGSITFDGAEKAHKGLVDNKNAVIFKFTFESQTDRPGKYSGVFTIRYYQNGVEVDANSWISSDGKEQYDLCGNAFREVMKGGTINFAQPIVLKQDTPVTIIVKEVDNPENFQAIEVDVSAFGLPAAEEQLPEDKPAVEVPEGAINMTAESGSLQYLGFAKANKGLVDAKNAMVFQFVFTNGQAMPAKYSAIFEIKYFQNGVEVSASSWISSDGKEQYDLCGNAFQEVMKDGTVTFGIPVEVKDDSPVTIIVEEVGNPDNYQTMEVTIAG